MSGETCGSCKFFVRDAPMQIMGKCHGVPPTLLLLGRAQNGLPIVDSFWPPVPDTETSCGTYQLPKPRAASINLAEIATESLEGNA